MIIQGYIDGVYYAVTVGAPRPEAAASIGIVSGSRRAVLLLEQHNTGQEIPEIGAPLDVNDAESVRAVLEALTEVIPNDDGAEDEA
ncbi:hypothetical protein [Streptosporangium sp. NPDC051022]|uniref:hypothetical protein n=1 Tax=Streptosporangium sp. NPDC051022 TaxID=3155752 RepID=UPI00341BA200